MHVHLRSIMLYVFLAAVSFSFGDTRYTNPPDYRNEKEARYTYAETCADEAVAAHFNQREHGDDYYRVTEITTVSSRVFIKVLRIVEKHKISEIEFYVIAPDKRLSKVDEARWWKELENEAPAYTVYVQGLSDACKTTYVR